MSERLVVSVVIATLDRPGSLARCVDALFGGRAAPCEVIVADQSAGPGTRDAVEERASRGLPIVHLPLPRRGVSRARNAGVATATSSIVAFTDDDCVPDDAWLVELLGVLQGDPGAAAVAGRVLPLGPPAPQLHAVASRTRARPADHRGPALPWRVGTGGNIAVRREWLERVGGWDERLGPGAPGRAAEDVDLIRRLLRSGARIRYTPAALVLHERVDERGYRASRRRYGFGMGAAAGLWMREGDPLAPLMLVAWLGERLRLLGGALLHGRAPAARAEARMLTGALDGVYQGLRLGSAWKRTSPRQHRRQDDGR